MHHITAIFTLLLSDVLNCSWYYHKSKDNKNEKRDKDRISYLSFLNRCRRGSITQRLWKVKNLQKIKIQTTAMRYYWMLHFNKSSNKSIKTLQSEWTKTIFFQINKRVWVQSKMHRWRQYLKRKIAKPTEIWGALYPPLHGIKIIICMKAKKFSRFNK